MKELPCARNCPFNRACGTAVAQEANSKEKPCTKAIETAMGAATLVPDGRFIKGYAISTEGQVEIGTAVDGRYEVKRQDQLAPVMV